MPTPAPGYYSHCRRDVLPYIPDTAKRILSLGCGSAETEHLFSKARDCHITGLELKLGAAHQAEKKIHRVIDGPLENSLPTLIDERFDCILALDILEHLEDPWDILSICAGMLAPGGVIVASIPNVNHASVRSSLALDRWPYVPAGIFDESHLRFFTLTEIYKLFGRASLKICQTNPFKSRQESAQYIVVARPVSSSCSAPVTSIIIPTFNALPLTKNCIASIRQNTKAPYRLFVVDNGSTDGTRDWLKTQDDIVHILNATNLGFGPAVNSGIFCATTPSFLILNNDTLVPDSWLTNLLAHFNANPRAGIVAPMSNFVSGPQLYKCSPDYSIKSVDQHAARLFSLRQGMSSPSPRVVFFCALIKKAVFDKIGYLDERFIIGNFEDDDYCRRAALAGFDSLVALDSFVFHLGHQTFTQNNLPLGKLLDLNRQFYLKKWGAP